jgi:hypothetical protein
MSAGLLAIIFLTNIPDTVDPPVIFTFDQKKKQFRIRNSCRLGEIFEA